MTHGNRVVIGSVGSQARLGGVGVKSCAHWLNWKCGICVGAAREKGRVARALEQLPQVAEAMAQGRLSYFKVREMTRVANRLNEFHTEPDPKNVPAGTFSEADDLQRVRKRRVEALATMAESFLAAGPRELSGADRQQIVVHVDAETLKHSHADGCELELENEKGQPLNSPAPVPADWTTPSPPAMAQRFASRPPPPSCAGPARRSTSNWRLAG